MRLNTLLQLLFFLAFCVLVQAGNANAQSYCADGSCYAPNMLSQPIYRSPVYRTPVYQTPVYQTPVYRTVVPRQVVPKQVVPRQVIRSVPVAPAAPAIKPLPLTGTYQTIVLSGVKYFLVPVPVE